MRRRPPYWKPPRDRCEACGSSLYQRPRYRVKIYHANPLFQAAPLKTMVVCETCLEGLKQRIKGSKSLARLLKLKYRRIPTLGS